MQDVNRWEPITEEYKDQTAHSAEIDAEIEQKLEKIRKEKGAWTAKKAPIGIRIFTWYCFGRAGFYAVLLGIVAAFPQSVPSTWLVANLEQFLKMPAAASRSDDARNEDTQKETEPNGYLMPDAAVADQDAEESKAQAQREEVMVYLLMMAIATAVVGFMWWNHSWKVRWIAMFYAGAMVAKAATNYIAGLASGFDSDHAFGEILTLALAIAVNGLIFCYLAFWPDVKGWSRTPALTKGTSR